MLVCPHCQFENPDTNKFCQECGTSLTQNGCPECGSLVSFDAVQCQECGAIAGIIWWAVIIQDGQKLESAQDRGVGLMATASDSLSPDSAAYLDEQHRYRILEVLPTGVTPHEQQVKVLDCTPFQPSLLEVLIEQAIPTKMANGSEAPLEVAEPEPATELDFLKRVSIPAIAQPYLDLSGKFYQALPIVRDAWQQDSRQVLILEDRSQYPLLLDLWCSDELPLPTLQILHWLYEMVELWVALEPVACLRSLLESPNLRVDEDQSLCLQRLYLDSPGTPPTLQDLGQLWEMLFGHSQRTQFGAVAMLLIDLREGRLTTVDSLRSRIETIAQDFQVAQVEPPAEDFFPSEADAIGVNSAAAVSSSETDARDAGPTTATQLDTPDDAADSDESADGDNEPTVVLPMQLFNLEDVGRTDIGRQRPHNEDYFGIESQVVKLESPSGKTIHVRNLYVLCDGMGGQADGEVASALAVDTLRRYFKSKWQSSPFVEGGFSSLPGVDLLTESVQLANQAIYDINQQNARSGSGRMGTTLVMALIQDTELAIAHVGDSRLYRYTRKRGLEQLTIDHEVGQREIQRGVDAEAAYARPDAYQLTQALGPRDENFVKPDVQYLELNEDALFLLCSDGLTDNDLLERHCRTHVEPLLSSQANLEQGVNKLIELANRYNGHDNITAIVIRAKVRPDLAHLR